MKTTYSWRPGTATAAAVNIDRKAMNRLLRRTAELAGLPAEEDWCAAVRFVGDRAMIRANAEYVGHEGTTDVITFSYFDDPESLFTGDVAVEKLVCADVGLGECRKRKDSDFAGELTLYIAHGFLHAAGEDDLTPGPRRRMRRREREVMAALRREFDLNRVFGIVSS